MLISFCSECGIRMTLNSATTPESRCKDCIAGRRRRRVRHGDSGAVPRATVNRILNMRAH